MLLRTLVPAAGLVPLLRFVVSVTRVKGRSMLPTLKNGDVLIVWRLLPFRRAFRRGDLVICHYPGRYLLHGRYLRQCFVKRVVGLPG